MKPHFAILACGMILSVQSGCSGAPAGKSGFITTGDGVSLHYLESGNGPAILFVPGWTMPAEIWEPQIRYFAREYRVVAMDPRSQGESAQTTEGHYPARRARDIREVVDQLKLAPVVLVGWSLGVGEVLVYVDQFGTATLRAVVLVDGNIGGEADPLFVAQRWAWLKEVQQNRKEATERFVRGMYRKRQSEAYYRKIIAASLKTPTNTAVALLSNVYSGADWRPALAKLDCPVLYTVTPALTSQSRMLKAKLPEARVEIFEDCGHALFVDDAERFNKVLEEFLHAGSAAK
jgi:microsomal epoxide hydrolase